MISKDDIESESVHEVRNLSACVGSRDIQSNQNSLYTKVCSLKLNLGNISLHFVLSSPIVRCSSVILF